MHITSIRENGLYATLFRPKCNVKLPSIILLPGSEGGIPESFAKELAFSGYCVLALGYFGLEGLPNALENISLEYFQKAFLWLRNQAFIKSEKVCLIGYSRGGELALLLGSIYHHLIHAIIAYVPCSSICGGFPHPNKPAWLLNNQPIFPFLSGYSNDDINLTEEQDLFLATKSKQIPFHANTVDDPYIIKDLFLVRNKKYNWLSEAAIPVENIRCPLLLISAESDQIWPSALYAQLIMERLEQKKSRIVRKHICFSNAGHGITKPYEGSIYHPIGKFWCKLGGTLEGNVIACKKSFAATLDFLNKIIM